jgi:hypothetical protein
VTVKCVKGVSILFKIPEFDCIWDVPIDFMHCVCLGVMKAVITYWLSNNICWKNGYDKNSIKDEDIFKNLMLPDNICRNIRRISEANLYKASERFFILDELQ